MARLVDLAQKLLLIRLASHGQAAARARINGRDDRADLEVPLAGLVGQAFDFLVAPVDVEVRVIEEDVEAVEARAVALGGGGQVEHGVQVDGRLAALAFAHQARPGGVVELGIVVGMCVGHGLLGEHWILEVGRKGSLGQGMGGTILLRSAASNGTSLVAVPQTMSKLISR